MSTGTRGERRVAYRRRGASKRVHSFEALSNANLEIGEGEQVALGD